MDSSPPKNWPPLPAPPGGWPSLKTPTVFSSFRPFSVPTLRLPEPYGTGRNSRDLWIGCRDEVVRSVAGRDEVAGAIRTLLIIRVEQAIQKGRQPTSHERLTGLPWDASYHDGPALGILASRSAISSVWTTKADCRSGARLRAAGPGRSSSRPPRAGIVVLGVGRG